ncbi:MAG: FecR family protein [Pedobacter sp.]|nr:MAG: FecR family protein [Pedobacter sp.]
MEDKIWVCIVKRFNATETEDSARFLNRWLNEDEANVQKFREAKTLWEMTAMIQHEETDEDPRILTMNILEHKVASTSTSFWKYSVAATLIGALLFAGLYYFKHYNVSAPEEWVVNKASAGNIIEITLPDQSKVWLNSETEIRYRKKFSSSKLREIHLKGEAYFEVKHDEEHPFVVNSGALKTTVYGTSFSIKSYNEAESSVAVNSGRVGVQLTKKAGAAIMLLPKDKLSLRKAKLEKTRVELAEVNSWIRDEMIFEQTPMKEVFAVISKRYQVKVDYDKKRYSECKLTASFKNEPLSAVLKTLNISMNISSKQVGETIYVKGGDCM